VPSSAGSRAKEGDALSVTAVSEVASAGLCVTCANADTCVYRKARGKDAQYCEMFDSSNGGSGARAVTFVAPVEPQVREQTALRGLCVNCEHRDSCTLPRAEGGVWHCEEYE
jgi:hypothetical protein